MKKIVFCMLLMFLTVLTFASISPPVGIDNISIQAITDAVCITQSEPVAMSRIDYLTSGAVEALKTETAQVTSTTTVTSHFTGVDEIAGYTLTTIKPDLTNYSPKKGLMVADEKTIIYKGAVFRSSFLFEVKLN